MKDLIETLVRPELRALSAYHVPDASGLIKLDAMENPYGWPETLRNEWLDALRDAELNRYPDPRARELQSSLREAMSIPHGMDIVLGNGSDELIQMLALTMASPGDGQRPQGTLLSFDPGFVMYRMIALFAGLRYTGVSLNASDFSLDLDSALEAIERDRPVLTFVAYPNNPTGNLFDATMIERIVESSPGLVVVDEAYAPFTDSSFLPRLGDWPNLLVMRTVSKMGLAGLRLGYLVGPSEWIEQIDKVRLPYNINVLSQASAAFALRNREVLDRQTRAIRTERARMSKALGQQQSPGGSLTVYPSEANFILVRTPAGRADQTFEGLRKRRVLVKNLNGTHPLVTDCLRITVSHPDENDILLKAIGQSLANA